MHALYVLQYAKKYWLGWSDNPAVFPVTELYWHQSVSRKFHSVKFYSNLLEAFQMYFEKHYHHTV